MNPKISIIVPVYNVDIYLERCLDSIVNQSMKEIEIIVIDGGSTDKSGYICDSYASLDKRIKVIHKNNNGVSHSRNVGLDQAQGEYIMFVDSDDYVDKFFCQIPYELAEENDSDLLIFNYRKVNEEFEFGIKKRLLPDGRISKKDVVNYLNSNIHDYVWNKIYRKKLFDGIRFPVNEYYEDILVFYKVLLKAHNIYHINSVLYYYFSHEESLTNRKTYEDRRDYLSHVYKKTCDLINCGYEYYTEPVAVLRALRYLTYFGFQSELSYKCCELLKHVDKNDFYNFKTRTLLFLFNHSKFLFSILCIVLNKRSDTEKYLLK